MQIHQILGISLLCAPLYFSPVQADCEAFTVVVSSCIKSFAIVNEKAKTTTDSRTCPTYKFEDSCLSYTFLKKCLGEKGNAIACNEKIENEFKKEGFPCTLKEIEDAVGTCGASLTSCSVLVLIIAAMWTILSTIS